MSKVNKAPLNKTIKTAVLDTRTPEGRKALRLLTVQTSDLLSRLGLPHSTERDEYYSKAALCLMAVQAGLTLRDFM